MVDVKDKVEDVLLIAREAGSLILDIYDTYDFDNLKVITKDDNSPLTIADKASHNHIEKELTKLDSSIPILSEEGSKVEYSDRSKWDRFWMVDPLDGTKEFIKRNGEFTVNIALIEKGAPVLGVVFAPVLDTIWYGTDLGSYRVKSTQNPESISVKAIKKDKPVIVVASRSHLGDKVLNFVEKYDNYEFLQMGSSIKLCLVADGTAHIYPRLGPTMEWDTAAAHAVVLFAGGDVLDNKSGKRLTYNKQNLLNPDFVVLSKESVLC